MEIWKEIDGYPNYMVSNLGNVKSLNYKGTGREGILTPFIDSREGKGYLRVTLCKNGKAKRFQVHRLVAEAFIPNPYNLPQVNHKDENKQSNVVENLEWCDNSYNVNYGTRNKRNAEKLSKPIFQIDKYTNEIIAEFPSLIDIERQFRYSIGLISRCCKDNTKSAYGYKWQYKNG